MAISDSETLELECPACGGQDVSFAFWPGAWRLDSGKKVKRVPLGPGQTKEVDCTCLGCRHVWAEYVTGE